MLNIVEGCGASVLPSRNYQQLAAETIEIRRMICGYRSKLLITARVGDKSSG
jgi:hypothetical protein